MSKDYSEYEIEDYDTDEYEETKTENRKEKKMREKRSGFRPWHLVLILLAAAAGVAGYIVFGMVQSQFASLNTNNQELAEELSTVRQNLYVANRNILAGEEIVYIGENANVNIMQVYSSVDKDIYLYEDVPGYAQVDIKVGTPLYTSMVGDMKADEPAEPQEPERIVEEVEVPETISIPYTITATFFDNAKEPTQLLEPRTINLSAGVGEEAFSSKQEALDGYRLVGIQINGADVHSFGAVRKQMNGQQVFVYYYTDKGGLNRYEIKEDLTVAFTYEALPEREAEKEIDADASAVGIPVGQSPVKEEPVAEEPVDETAEGTANE